MPGFLLSALHALSRCFSRSHPWITWFKSIRGANGKWRFLGSIIDLQHQHLMVGVEDLPSVILMHVNFKGHCIISYCTRDATAIFFPSTPPISVLKCLWRREEKKNPMDCETWSNVCLSFSCWWLQMFLHSQIAFEAPSMFLYCSRVK